MANEFYDSADPDDDNDTTLGDERQRLDDIKRAKGTHHCKACRQAVKYRDRKIKAHWVIGLMRMFRVHLQDPWHHSDLQAELRNLVAGTKRLGLKGPKKEPGNDWRFMRSFGLIEELDDGYWCISALGHKFLTEKSVACIPKSVTIYNKEVVGKLPDEISYNEACRQIGEFDERELSMPSLNPPLDLETKPEPRTQIAPLDPPQTFMGDGTSVFG